MVRYFHVLHFQSPCLIEETDKLEAKTTFKNKTLRTSINEKITVPIRFANFAAFSTLYVRPLISIYTVSQKKRGIRTFYDNFINC